MDITSWYVKVNTTHEALVASKTKGERPWDPDEHSVWLISQNQSDLGAAGGRDDVAVMCLLENRGQKRAALALCEVGRPFRLSVAADAEPGGAIANCLRIQSENLAQRRLADAKASKERPFLVQIPGEA